MDLFYLWFILIIFLCLRTTTCFVAAQRCPPPSPFSSLCISVSCICFVVPGQKFRHMPGLSSPPGEFVLAHKKQYHGGWFCSKRSSSAVPCSVRQFSEPDLAIIPSIPNTPFRDYNGPTLDDKQPSYSPLNRCGVITHDPGSSK